MGTLEQMVKHFEGFSGVVYRCPRGHKTIGYGHRLRPGENLTTLSEQEASLLLTQDLAEREKQMLSAVKVPLTLGQRGALIDFVFNLGIGRFLMSTALKELNRGNYGRAAQELLKWNKLNGKKNKGLVRRRKAEWRMFTGQNWETGKILGATNRCAR